MCSILCFYFVRCSYFGQGKYNYKLTITSLDLAIHLDKQLFTFQPKIFLVNSKIKLDNLLTCH